MTRRRRGAAIAGAIALLGLLLPVPSSPAATETVAASAGVVTAAPGGGYKATKTLTREFVEPDGEQQVVATYDMTVEADHTRNLRGRERVEISWSGAPTSGGRASNPYGENGLLQEYPVVIMQCRGVDNPKAPRGQRLTPETCWTSSVAQRSQPLRSETEATWTQDLYADEADREPVSGADPFPSDQCPNQEIDGYFTHITPFDPQKGETYPACNDTTMPPEAAIGAAFPPAELAAFSDDDGSGSVQFEVRSDVENESLGCSDKVACSIVVVPIVGLSCDQPSSPMTAGDRACRQFGEFAPGSSNFAGGGVDQAVAPSLWWSESNWRNRFSIPIDFGLPPDACDVLDDRPPLGFYGSELMAQAALQWTPAYCLREDRFKFQLNQMSDQTGWNTMQSGEGAAAFVSSEYPITGTDPVGYGPSAVTGFAIGYSIDRPDNAGEYGQLKMTPRLIAKLLTQSYLGSDLGRDHPGIKDNPLAIMEDPEFQRLNPGLSDNVQEAGATLLSLSNDSDIISQLSSYLAQDAEAMAFIGGKPDPWGMRVNPAYEDIALPVASWPLLDTYIPETENTCRQKNPAVYFTQLAAPVTTLRKISDALIDSWPNVQTRCEYDPNTKQYKLGRVDRQSFGSRFMLGIVSLGDADRFGLRTAALETRAGTYVTPSAGSMSQALRVAEQTEKYGPFPMAQRDLVGEGSAYPGTMIVYTAARLRNLAQADADRVAQFIRVAVTEGQRQGSGNGQLPGGYLPIVNRGPTAPLYRSALEVADAIEAQTPLPEDEDDAGGPGGGDPGDPGDVGDTGPGGPGTAGPGDPGDGTVEADLAPTSGTQAADSAIGRLLLPAVLALAVVGLIGSLTTRFRRPRSSGPA